MARTKIIFSSLLKCSLLFTVSAAAIYSLLLPYYLTYLGFLPLAWFLHPVNMATWHTNYHKHLLRLTHSCAFLSPTARLTSISLAALLPTQPFPGTISPHTLGRCQEYFLPIVEPAALSAPILWGRNTMCALMSLYFCCLLFFFFLFPGFHFLLSH